MTVSTEEFKLSRVSLKDHQGLFRLIKKKQTNKVRVSGSNFGI